MSIKDRNLRAGTRLTARYKGATHRAEVVETDHGLRYRLEDGREFKSPSGAARAVMGGKAVNGWRFWDLAENTAAASNSAAKSERKAPAKAAAKKSKNGGTKPAGEAAASSA